VCALVQWEINSQLNYARFEVHIFWNMTPYQIAQHYSHQDDQGSKLLQYIGNSLQTNKAIYPRGGLCTYRMKTKYTMYVAKNHINCECDDGIPYSVYRTLLCIGLASQNVYLSTKFRTSFNVVPKKNVICKTN